MNQNESIGKFPAFVDVVFTGEERGVYIESDHNTSDWDTELNETQIRELRDALSRWLDDGGNNG